MARAISIDRASLATFCRLHHIRRLSLFGSVFGANFRADSEGALVEFDPAQVPGFLALHEIETELSKLLGGREVHVVTQRSLNDRLRDRVLAAAQVEYMQPDEVFGEHDGAI